MLSDMLNRFFIILVALVFASLPVYLSAEIYTWTDDLGRVHFTDSPPDDTQTKQVDIGPLNTYNSPSQDSINDTLSRPTGVTAKKAKVTIYTAVWCGVCTKAKRWLRKNNIAFREYDIEKSERGRNDYKKMKGRGVPIIKIGKQKFTGFRPTSMTAALRKAGYAL